MGVTVTRRGPKLVFASLLAGGALVASATGAFAWTPPTVTQKCFDAATSTIEVDVTGGVDNQDKPIDKTQVLYGKAGDVLTTNRFVDNSNGKIEAFTYKVKPEEDCKPKPSPSPSPSPSSSPSPTPTPTPTASAGGQGAGSPSPSSGQGAATPGLPNTGFDPNG